MSSVELLPRTAQEVSSKVVLAADESTGTITNKLAGIDVISTPEINKQYREMLFNAPGIENYVSGVILYDETIGQEANDGTPFAQLLSVKGIAPGIKVDAGTETIPGFAPNKFTQGLDGLGKRLDVYKEKGAVFAKWRAVFTVPDDESGRRGLITTIRRNAIDLALYAKICQDKGIVPIVEPEVLMTGKHSIEDCEKVTTEVLFRVFEELEGYDVSPSGMILKPNMVISGEDAAEKASPEAVAKTTIKVLRSTVNPQVPGIAFLSGGQTPDEATEHLNLINLLRAENEDPLSQTRFTASFGRALQDEALAAWLGKMENVQAAQAAFIARAEKVYQASNGQLQLS